MHCNSAKDCLFVIIIDLTFFCWASSQSTDIFVNMDDALTLPCTVYNNTKASWEGPCTFILNTTGCISTTTPYFDGLRRYKDLPGSISLETYKQQTGYSYNLHIVKISMENTGSYKCFRFDGTMVKEKNFEVILKVKPSNPIIENMTFDSRMTGTGGVPLDLVCTVTSGTPLETMTWITDQSIVAEGGPGTIRYSFTPTSENNGQRYSCIVNNDALESPLRRTVQLDIKYQPLLQCADEAISVVEGNYFTVQCLAHSNPSPTMVRIKKHDAVIKRCSMSPCSVKLKSSRNDRGIYGCTAQNQIGDGHYCQTMVNILYSPVVSVVLLNDTTLRCSAIGEPNNVSYLSWYHYSDQGKQKHFDGSEYRVLCSSCKRYEVNGVYRCSATNGIRHTDESNISFGNVYVQLKGSPEILPKTKTIQYGKYRKSVLLEIFVYSTTAITIEKILRNDKAIESSGRIATNGSLRNEHKVTYPIAVSQKADFTKYTFEVKNDQGATPITVSLVAKDIPETPVIKRLTVKDSNITVHFNDTFDGGLSQVYVLQYRSTLNWISVEVNDTFDGVGSYTLQNLDAGERYFFRIYSVNSVGKSNFSEVWSLELTVDVTDDRKSENDSGNSKLSIPYANIGISVGSSIVGTLVSLFIYRCCKKIRKSSNINITTEPEVQYDEIDEGNLQEMDDIHVTPGTHVQEPSGLTNSQLDAQTEESSDLNDTSQSNVEIENGLSLDIILREASSSSEDMDDVHLPRHSYINVPSFLGNKYESLEAPSLEDVDNYNKISTNVPLETNYYNLRV